MSEEQKKDPILEKPTSRREFLKNSGLTVGGLVLGGALGGTFLSKTETVTKEVEVQVPVEVEVEVPAAGGETHSHETHVTHNYSDALLFFTRLEDFLALSAATEVIYPEDEHGPGAIKLGAPFYIDKQLASPWGRNTDDYMVRPFKPGESPLTRGEIVLQGVRKINETAQSKHQKLFKDLTEEEQIAILKEFEAGNVPLELTTSAAFFGLLRTLTIEGCFCDPVHGGNKNMEGWIMAEFPGAIMSHIDVIEKKEFVVKKPQSLSNHIHI
ncbi:gluconate 2-dehydrogenase subunit 3 family protein [Ureibacillus manganicus]|uniref:Dehydrogenase n=1 Tax=Ureibacillus manganicus DSM 26584 TaxID=1384049 RepID=A0A0A3I8L3_9BACL|nr:gluconate 2-dehydrogenase subunit 3 family protein [Ureibacillus manganicus]KGR79795.1 hypothetical protein CD29_04475 [Ureibacillus manganicus DSM 26584]